MKRIFTIAILTLTVNAFAQVPTNGLVGWYPFNGNANDATGYGNNGTIFGANLSTDRFTSLNSAFEFNGTTEVIKIEGINDSLTFDALTDSYSISLWLKSVNQNQSGRIFTDNDGNPGYSFIIWANLNQVRLGIFDGTNNPTQIILGAFDGSWHMITMIVDNNKDSIYGYLDNSLVGSTLNTLTSSTNNSDTIFIGNRNLQNNGFDGQIDDIRIYNRILNPSEINLLYNEGLCYQTIVDTVYISVTDTLIINTVLTGVTPPNNLNTLKIYPNPASTDIYIDNGDYTAMNGYTIRIDNGLSQTVFTSLINQPSFYINLSTWSGIGLYYVYIIDNLGNTIATKKIILQ